MRLKNNPNAMNELIESKVFIQDFPYTVNKNDILEIGMGKGEMITQMALNNQKKKYIGIEKYATVAHKAMKKAEELKLKNFNIIVEDIANIPPLINGKVKTIWLTFSDPWPKARHEKRRLTHRGFINIYKELLTNDGVIMFKTDNDKFFEWSVEHMKEYGLKLSNVTRDFHNHESSKENIMTGYEIKWSSQGKKINYLEARF